MKTKHKIISIIMSMAMLCCAATPIFAIEDRYTDVSGSQWYFYRVYDCRDRGIINGTSKYTFSPDKNVTRAEFATMLTRMYAYAEAVGQNYKGSSSETTTSAILSKISATNAGTSQSLIDSTGFKDVPANSYYAGSVVYAYQQGWINGTSKTTFSPNSPVTREQMFVVLYRIDTSIGYDSVKEKSNSDSDKLAAIVKEYRPQMIIRPLETPSTLSYCEDSNDVSIYAQTAVNWALANGLVYNSRIPKRIRPKEYSNRGWTAGTISEESDRLNVAMMYKYS